MVGWSWTGILSVECNDHYTFNCPSSLSPTSAVLFFANSGFYIFGACLMYHAFIEKINLERRAEKVAQIQHGDAERFFRDVDANNDGMITRSELNEFLRTYGFDSHCFDT